MKSRLEGKTPIKRTSAPIKENDKVRKNREIGIRNAINMFLTIMEADGNLSEEKIRYLIDNTLKDSNYKFSNPEEFIIAVNKYGDLRDEYLGMLDKAYSSEEFAKIIDSQFDNMDIAKSASAITNLINYFCAEETRTNYYCVEELLRYAERRNLVCLNWVFKHNEDAKDSEDKIKMVESSFFDYPIYVSYSRKEAKETTEVRNDIMNIGNLSDLIKIQKPYDVLEYLQSDEAKFKVLYTYEIYCMYKHNEHIINTEIRDWDDCDEIHRNARGYEMEKSCLMGMFSKTFMDIDKFLLTTGHRAIDCLKNEDYPIDKKDLISICIGIEDRLKDKNAKLSNRYSGYSVEDFVKEINENEDIIKRKLASNKIKKDDVLEMYVNGTNPKILDMVFNDDELEQLVSVDNVIDAYSKYISGQNAENKNRFNKVAKLYRDRRIQRKKANGDFLNDEYKELKEKLENINGNNGILDFYKMGILDVDSLIQFNDKKLVKEAFVSGILSKSDMETLDDLNLMNKKSIKSELSKVQSPSKKELISNNLTLREKNPKRRFMYSLDDEARNVEAGDGYEIFFINDKAVIIDSLKDNVKTGESTLVVDKDFFENEFGLNGFFDSDYLNKRKDGEVSLNKSALTKMKEHGTEIEFSQNWCDAMLATIVGPEEERIRRYDEDTIAEQKRIIKNIQSLQK